MSVPMVAVVSREICYELVGTSARTMSNTGQLSSKFIHAHADRMHSHRHAEVVVGLGGSATIGTDCTRWFVRQGSLLWLAGDAPHAVDTTVDSHWLVLTFAPESIGRPTGWIHASGFVHDLVERVARTRDPERRERLTAVLVDELGEPASPNTRLERVRAIVTQHPGMRMAAIAHAVGMSERAFRRWFRADTGTTFASWQQQLVVEQATQLLRRGASVKSVATDLGYASVSAFSAMFKRVAGASPQHYNRFR